MRVRRRWGSELLQERYLATRGLFLWPGAGVVGSSRTAEASGSHMGTEGNDEDDFQVPQDIPKL